MRWAIRKAAKWHWLWIFMPRHTKLELDKCFLRNNKYFCVYSIIIYQKYYEIIIKLDSQRKNKRTIHLIVFNFKYRSVCVLYPRKKSTTPNHIIWSLSSIWEQRFYRCKRRLADRKKAGKDHRDAPVVVFGHRGSDIK